MSRASPTRWLPVVAASAAGAVTITAASVLRSATSAGRIRGGRVRVGVCMASSPAPDAGWRPGSGVGKASRLCRALPGKPIPDLSGRGAGGSDELGAAVDVQRLAGDVRRLVAAQERRRGGDVLRVADPSDGVGLGAEP